MVFSYETLPHAEQEIYSKISDICVSLKSDDYLDLPPVIYNQVSIKLPKNIMSKYYEFERELVLSMSDEIITASSAGVLTGKLLQFASGAIYDEGRNIINIHDYKLDALEEIQVDNIGKKSYGHLLVSA